MGGNLIVEPICEDEQAEVMPRKKRWRRVFREPTVSVFKPAGVPAKELEEILLAVDEFEALRLADYEGMNQRDASEIMGVSQPTFHRILSSARHKVAKGLVEGQVIRIEGGRYILADGSGVLVCQDCGQEIDPKELEKTETCPRCGSRHIRWLRWGEHRDRHGATGHHGG